MTFVDRPLPEGLELPRLREKHPNSLANLTYREGRIPGTTSKITKSLKEGIIEGAVAWGADGAGTGGLHGYLTMAAGKYTKAYLQLLGRVLPMQSSGFDGIPTPTVSVSIVSIPSGDYLSQQDCERLSTPGRAIEHEPIVPVQAKPEAPLQEEHTPTEEQLLAEVRDLARRCGVDLDKIER